MDSPKSMDPQRQIVSYFLTWFLQSSNQKCSFSWILFGCRERCGGVLMVGSLPSTSIISPQQPPRGASLCSLNGCPRTPPIMLDYHLRPDWPYEYIYWELNSACHYAVANLVTVTKTNMIRRNALWFYKNHCRENTVLRLPQYCAVVSASLEVSCRCAQRSQELQNLTIWSVKSHSILNARP